MPPTYLIVIVVIGIAIVVGFACPFIKEIRPF